MGSGQTGGDRGGAGVCKDPSVTTAVWSKNQPIEQGGAGAGGIGMSSLSWHDRTFEYQLLWATLGTGVGVYADGHAKAPQAKHSARAVSP